MKKLFSDWLTENNACEDAVYFVEHDCDNDVRTALKNCPDPYWLAWIEERIEGILHDGDIYDSNGSYSEWNTGFVSGALAVLDADWYENRDSRDPVARQQVVDLYYAHVTPMDEIQRNILDQNVLLRPVRKKAVKKAVVKKVAKKAKKTTPKKGR